MRFARAPAGQSPAVNCDRLGRPKFSSTDRSSTSPCALRSSGSRQMPARIASRGVRMSRTRPSSAIVPASRRSAPKIRRAVSVRPAPTSPVSASTSPRRTWKETPFTSSPRRRPDTTSRGWPMRGWRRGNSFSSFRPTIISISCWRVISLVGRVATCFPSRITIDPVADPVNLFEAMAHIDDADPLLFQARRPAPAARRPPAA